MARPFSPNDAKRLLRRHEDLEHEFQEPTERSSKYRNDIKFAAENYVNARVADILKDISIDELNRDKSGLRIGVLKEAGIGTVRDVLRYGQYRLSEVHGISLDGAYQILSRAKQLEAATARDIRIKLSSDDQDPYSTKLIIAVAKFRHAQKLVEINEIAISKYRRQIDYSKSDLESSRGRLKWLFASADKRGKATKAYDYLNEILYGEYAQTADLSRAALSSIEYLSSSDCWNEFAEDPIKFFNVLDEIVPNLIGYGDDASYGLPEEIAKAVQDQCYFPEGLLCELRPYQEWGVKYILHQERVLLGDEMGLGKTIQAIASMVSLRNTGATHFAVVCPASVVANWCREIQSKSLLRAVRVHGLGRQAAIEFWEKSGGVAVTTYETIGSLSISENFKFSLLVVDEAHYIKNPIAQRTQNVKRLSAMADRCLFMTGTALENKVDEMIALMEMLQPEIASKAKGITYLASAPRFREMVAPVYYRRKRDMVLSELPELIENEDWCELHGEELAIYEKSVLSRKYAEARRVSWNVPNLAISCKANRLKEIVSDAEEDNRKVLVFSFFLDTLDKIANCFENKCVGVINGSVPPARRQEIVDNFEKAPAGSILVAQIQSGGTGLNIQAASVVVICEPQFKPSVENQAISRAHRMGQARNVLVHRLLCQNTIDERLMEILANKQRIFDAYADKSVAAEEVEIDDKTFGSVIREEIDRINAKNGTKDNVGQPEHNSDCVRQDNKEKSSQYVTIFVGQSVEKEKTGAFSIKGKEGCSVTQRIRKVSQPRGGYINPKSLAVIEMPEYGELSEDENIHKGLIGSAVEYLTRFESGAEAADAFAIACSGAKKLAKVESHAIGLYQNLLTKIRHGLADETIIAAIKLSGFDCCFRKGLEVYRPVEDICPNSNTINNVRIMVERSLVFFSKYGPVTMSGFNMLGGYTNTVSTGDGDFLTHDTLWDFKVSVNPPNSKHTLQLLMYWRMGVKSIYKEFKEIRYLGIFNPRLNTVYRINVNDIDEEVINAVERDVICY